ncbi:hypothetical protein C8E00_103222 [Chromohalobacter marismortui]|uniref:Uncharacterized protein n=1 Tax=Chromohalobacter marismortui TaxID=42055 RepID=A0A4R7NR38_9GAMM|nr:hypothetical protein C8E00_103222 [Chromohalobacter marismortui]
MVDAQPVSKKRGSKSRAFLSAVPMMPLESVTWSYDVPV